MDLFDIDDAQKNSQQKLRINELEKLISKYQAQYYNGESEISDFEFDKLWDELKLLDPDNGILKKVGADSGNFEKASHVMPMGSQEKAANPEQFLEWAVKHNYSEYLVEYKLDGASLELQYENGSLIRAVTRGDGTVGDVITNNALKMKGVPRKLSENFTGGVRGEVIMTHQVHKEKYSDKANCRNAANGLMKRKNGEGSENLELITYDVWSTTGVQPFSDEEEKLKWLKDNSFNTVPLHICKSAREVIEYRGQVMELRKNEIPYDIDGLVIKERTVNHQDASRARPDRQIAFKFSLEEAVTILRSVEWNENGATYTPVAIFDPVDLNGTTVQKASLANPNLIKNLGLKIGHKIVVVKRGEIIPKIESVLPESDLSSEQLNSLSEIIVPDKCLACGSSLVNDGTRLYCPNSTCSKKILHRLLKWTQTADIRDLGETLVASLFKSGLVKCISDLYSLTEQELTPFFLNEESIEDNKKSLGAQKVYASIQNHRTLTLSQFIAGFDIEGIGETLVDKLIDGGFNSLEKLINACVEEIASVYGFAEIMAASFVQGMRECKDEMNSLVQSGTIILKQVSGGKLEGKSFCFTGELHTIKRADAEKLVKENGGSAKSSVVKGLTYLVTNDKTSGSSKNVKAASLGIPVINEEEFLALFK